MADILIRGMEMPKCCNECRLAWIDVDHHWYCEANKPWGLDITGHVMSKHPDCPLIELPPHGRLIDADALIRRLNAARELAAAFGSEIAETVNDMCDSMIREIELMPIIVPVDKDGET